VPRKSAALSYSSTHRCRHGRRCRRVKEPFVVERAIAKLEKIERYQTRVSILRSGEMRAVVRARAKEQTPTNSRCWMSPRAHDRPLSFGERERQLSVGPTGSASLRDRPVRSFVAQSRMTVMQRLQSVMSARLTHAVGHIAVIRALPTPRCE